MKLALKIPPTPEYASMHADQIVQGAKEISKIELDYSPESLNLVDEIIENFRQEGLASKDIGETLFGFGCYVGEILVRNAEGVWKNTDDTSFIRR